MSGQDYNVMIDEMCVLIINTNEWITKPCQNEFINELCCDYYYICPKCFGFHPLGNNQNVSIFGDLVNSFDGFNEIQAPLHETWLNQQSNDQCGQVGGG
jgi:hypothetical protein